MEYASESALVIVDAQNTYRGGVMQLVGVEPALDECARLLARARELKLPVIHIQHDAGPGSPYDVRAEIGVVSAEALQSAGLAALGDLFAVVVRDATEIPD